MLYRATLELVNVDGTVGNTGHESGLLALLEEDLGRPVQWSVCILHHLERPWIRLFLSLDGRSLSKDTFEGPIGKKITQDVHELPVANFKKMEVHQVF